MEISIATEQEVQSIGVVSPNSLVYGDCLEVMKHISSNSVDMILCDLPYGTTACKWDTIIPFEPLWEQYERIVKNNGAIVLFGSEPFSSHLRLSNLKLYKYDWIWHKNTSGGFATAKKRPMKYHEIVSVFYKNQPTYNPVFQVYADSVYKRGQSKVAGTKGSSINGMKKVPFELKFERGKYPESVQFFKSVENANENRLHPTQKPIPLLEYLIKTYTNEGELVLDNTMGSGSTIEACLSTKRKFIGIELDEEYFNTATKRIEDYLNNFQFFF